MSIIDSLIQYWVNNIADITQEIEELETRGKEIEDLFESEECRRDNIAYEKRKIEELNQFLKEIGSTYSLSEGIRVCFSEDYIAKQREELDLVNAKLIMYRNYREIMERINSGLSVVGFNRECTIYISNHEFLYDIAVLNEYAKKFYREAEGEEYNFSKYIDSLNVFTPENMQKIGHPSNDEAFSNGVADGICSICRISWEIEYLVAAANRSEALRKSGDKKARHLYQKAERKNSVVTMWSSDDYSINYFCSDILKENVIYKLYLGCKDNLGFSLYDMDKNFVRKFLC